MRVTCILAVVIAAAVHASGTALAATKDSDHAAISNVASVDATEKDGGRMLRKVKEDEIEEERATVPFSKWFQHHLEYLKVSAKKGIPGTYENKLYRSFENAANNELLKRNRAANIRASTM